MVSKFIRPQSTSELSGLGEMLESYYKLQLKLKTAPKFTDALFLADLVCVAGESH